LFRLLAKKNQMHWINCVWLCLWVYDLFSFLGIECREGVVPGFRLFLLMIGRRLIRDPLSLICLDTYPIWRFANVWNRV
jgi:hypothetical protein